MRAFQLIAAAILLVTPLVSGHARLRDPPARTSAHHLGFPQIPPEYSDYQLNCGGYGKLQELHGACGICGDPADANPKQGERPNGKFATNTIVRTYKSGSVIDVEVEMQANHMGWFWFRICPASSPNVEVTQACLNAHEMKIISASPASLTSTNATTYELPNKSEIHVESNHSMYKFKVQLPQGMKCDRCVLQWDWKCNNRPGQAVQELFRGCADVKIE